MLSMRLVTLPVNETTVNDGGRIHKVANDDADMYILDEWR